MRWTIVLLLVYVKEINSVCVEYYGLEYGCSGYSCTNVSLSNASRVEDWFGFDINSHYRGRFDRFCLKIRHSKIRSLNSNILKKFERQNMWSLELIGTELENIEPETFSNTRQLSSLKIRQNPLRNLTIGALHSLTELLYLDLSDNNITTLSDYVFMGLVKLKKLLLGNNNLTELQDYTFRPLIELELFNVSNNPLEVVNNVTLTVTHFFAASTGLTNIKLDEDTLKIAGSSNVTFNLKAAKLIALDLANNNLLALGRSLVASVRLRSLNLTNNRIEELHDYTFLNLKQLETLNLQSNGLTYLPHGVFRDLESLTSLDLSSNGIEVIQFGLFDNLNKLRILNLSTNHIASFNTYTFRNKLRLINLQVDNNDLESIDLQGVLVPETKITLNHNKWNCRILSEIFETLDKQRVTVMDRTTLNTLNVRNIECEDNQQQEILENSNDTNLSPLENSQFLKFFKKDFRQSNFFKYFDKFNVTVSSKPEGFEKLLNFFKEDFRKTAFFRYFDKTGDSPPIINNRGQDSNPRVDELIKVAEHVPEGRENDQIIMYFQLIGLYTIIAILLYLMFSRNRRYNLNSVHQNQSLTELM